MISYSYYDQLHQGLRSSEQWELISNRTVHRLLAHKRILTSPQAAIKDGEGSMNLTFSQEENISIGFNVSLNLTVGETETGNADPVNDGSNGTIPFEIRDTLWIVIPISIIYSTLFVIGVLGNIITCIVISRNKSMHTATNYYLFSLAISDLLLLITGVPQDIYHIWYRFPYPFGNTVCKIVSFASESSVNATVLTITAFTVERYVAICKPFLSHTMSKLSRAVRFVLTIWVIAFSLAIPQALSMQIDTQFRMCTVRHEQTKHLFFISTVLVFICPMSVITILYILIWLQLRRSKVVRCGTYRSSSVRLKRSIFKRSSQQTVVTLHSDQNVSPLHHYSESVLASSMQHPRLAETLPTMPTSPYLHYAKSYPASPVRKHRSSEEAAKESVMSLARAPHHHLHQHRRHVQSLMPSQYCSARSSSLGCSGSTSVTDSHQKLEQQLSGASEDGRINYSTRAHYNSTRHVVKMLVAVVIAFFLCWAPFHAQRLMAVYANDHNQNAAIRTAFEILTCVSGILYYISTCINPVLYNIMSHKFREAFKIQNGPKWAAEGWPVLRISPLVDTDQERCYQYQPTEVLSSSATKHGQRCGPTATYRVDISGPMWGCYDNELGRIRTAEDLCFTRQKAVQPLANSRSAIVDIIGIINRHSVPVLESRQSVAFFAAGTSILCSIGMTFIHGNACIIRHVS